MDLSPLDFAAHLEHSLLLPDATSIELETVCDEAKAHRIGTVCVNPCRVLQAHHRLLDAGVNVCALIGYPLGASDSEIKSHETELAVDLGAQEIEMVMNLGRLKDGDDRGVLRELRDVVEAANGIPVKVVVEASRLSQGDKRRAASLIVESGARFLVLGTGYLSTHAEEVREWHEWLGRRLQIKVSGGVHDVGFAMDLIEAGASRLGSTEAPVLLKAFREKMTFLN